jgi:hypothetical protein
MIILDEAGVGMGNRSWYDKEQILLNQTLQTVRDDNMGVIFTLPRLEELDSQTIGRLHAMMQMRDIDDSGAFATARWKNISMSRDGRGNVYKKYPRIRVGGTERKVKEVAIAPPTTDLESSYEERKEAFKEKLYEETVQAYDDAAQDDDQLAPDEVAQRVIDNERADEFTSTHPQNKTEFIDKDLIRSEFDLSVRDAKTAGKLISKELEDK